MKGSCACGGIQYELSDAFLITNHCHCSVCRKVHGAAFSTSGHAQADAFRWIQGEVLLTDIDRPRVMCGISAEFVVLICRVSFLR